MDIAIDLQDDVALITMDDGKKNAIDLQALADLNVALDKAEADDTTGSGPALVEPSTGAQAGGAVGGPAVQSTPSTVTLPTGADPGGPRVSG